MEQKPNVIPTQSDKLAAEERAKIAAYEAEKKEVTNQVYTNAEVGEAQMDALEMMRRRTEQQMMLREKLGVVKDESLAEEKPSYQSLNKDRNEEQIRLRDEQLAKNLNLINKFQQQTQEAVNRKTEVEKPIRNMENNNNNGGYVPPNNPPKVQNFGENPSNINPYIIELSQPNYNSPFDVLPLPSKGKLYRNRKNNVRVSFMTTADENILTSPNLLKSGDFLEILINRKLLEQDLRYRDLHVGDRNAIMIWLRATGYGEMYPVVLLDENDTPFETEINLNELKMKELNVEADSEGLFDYVFPLSKDVIKFRLLNCGDVDDIEKIVEKEKENECPVDNSSIYKLERMIVEVNGNRNREDIRNYINSIRIKDGKSFNQYLEEIESGIDLNIEVQTPGGGSVKTFLPLNFNFFWPDFRL